MVRPLHYFTFILFAALALLPMLWTLPNPRHEPWVEALSNAAHVPLFAILQALAIYWLRGIKSSRWPRDLLILLSALVILAGGGLIELLQPSIGRDRSWLDFVHDGLGISATLAIYYSWRHLRRWQLPLTVSAATIFLSLGFALYPAQQALATKWAAEKSFPVLIDGDTAQVTRLIKPLYGASIDLAQAPATWSPAHPRALRVHLPQGGRLPGWVLEHPPGDWHGFDRLSFSAWSEAPKPIRFGVNFYSELHGERVLSVAVITLQPGANRIDVALEDLGNFGQSDVLAVAWHALDAAATVVWFDDVRLGQAR